MGTMNDSIQVYQRDKMTSGVLGYKIVFSINNENEAFNGFQMYSITRNNQWDEYKKFWGKVDEGYYIWAVPYMMSGRINMIAWDLFIEDSFGKSDISIKYLAKFSSFLESNFTWDIPKIEFYDYGIIC